MGKNKEMFVNEERFKKSSFYMDVPNKPLYSCYISSMDIEKNTLLFSSGDSNKNDPCENVPERFKNDFYRCLTYNRKESVAMWMVYSKKGCCMTMSKSLIENIAKYIDFLKLCDGNIKKHKVLKVLTSYELEAVNEGLFHLEYVYYFSKNNEEGLPYYIKRSTNACEMNQSCFDLLKSNHFIKSICWDYECEARLCISYNCLSKIVGPNLLEKAKVILLKLKPTKS